MKCADAQHLIHLSVGDDTLPDEERAISEHLHQCSDCRAYHAGMVDAMEAVYRFRDSGVVDREVSVWPAVRRTLRTQRVQPPRSQLHFSGGVVALCACSLILALVTIIQNLPATSPEFAELPGMWPDMSLNVSAPAGGTAMYPQRVYVPIEPLARPDGSSAGFRDAAGNRWLFPEANPPLRPVRHPGPVDF